MTYVFQTLGDVMRHARLAALDESWSLRPDELCPPEWWGRRALIGEPRPGWLERALCRHPDPIDDLAELCAVCPVRLDCLRDARIEHTWDPHLIYGFRGGLTARERLAAYLWGYEHKLLARPCSVAVCGTESGYYAHRRHREPTCQRCRDAHAAARRARTSPGRRRARRSKVAA